MLKFYAQWQHCQLQHLCKHRIISQSKVTYQKWYTSRSYYRFSQQLKNQTKKITTTLSHPTKLNCHLKTFTWLVPWRMHSEDSGLSMMIGVKEAMYMWIWKKFLRGRYTYSHSNVEYYDWEGKRLYWGWFWILRLLCFFCLCFVYF